MVCRRCGSRERRRPLRASPRPQPSRSPASSPGIEAGCWPSSEQPGHQLPAIGPIGKAGEEPGEGPFDERLGPVGRRVAETEVDEMDLDFAPSPERKHRDGMCSSRDRPDEPPPAIVGHLAKPLVHLLRPTGRIGNELCGRAPRSRLDLRRSARRASRVLLDEITAHRSVDAAARCLGIPGEVCQHVPDRPVRQQRRSEGDVISEAADGRREERVGSPATVDLGIGDLHATDSRCVARPGAWTPRRAASNAVARPSGTVTGGARELGATAASRVA